MSQQFTYVFDTDINDIISKAVNSALDQRLYSADEAATMLNMSVRSVRDEKEFIGFVHVRGAVKFKGVDLRNYIDRKYVPPVNRIK